MQFDRFQKIIEHNKKKQKEIVDKAKDFYAQMKLDYDRDILNLTMHIKPLFNEKDYLVLEIPFKDEEIGAVCYKNDEFGYTILNSALPKANVNFALAHEIYHVFYQKSLARTSIELYMNENYLENDEELDANLFAGVLLMPTNSFEKMFEKFKKEQTEEDTEIAILCKLMSYFQAPYMAVMIRAYELGLLQDGNVLKELLSVDAEDVELEFMKLWLDNDILCASRKDDYPRLENVVKKIGMIYENEDILSAATMKKVLANMQKIYENIRG